MDELMKRCYENQQLNRQFVEKSLYNDLYKGGNKHDFSTEERKKLAKKHEAMPDGSYPIRNEQDLKDAIKSYGRGSNPEKTKAWIKKRAKELGKESLLPEDWK